MRSVLTRSGLLFPFRQLVNYCVVNMSDSTEPISKNELKRRLKAEKKAQEKLEKEKDKQASSPPVKSDSQAEQDEDGSDPEAYHRIRTLAVKQLKEIGDNPFPHKWDVSIHISQFIEKYSYLENGKPFLFCSSLPSMLTA